MYYLEALTGITQLDIIKNTGDINEEPLFYNKIFTSEDGETAEQISIKPFKSLSIYIPVPPTTTEGVLLSIFFCITFKTSLHHLATLYLIEPST